MKNEGDEKLNMFINFSDSNIETTNGPNLPNIILPVNNNKKKTDKQWIIEKVTATTFSRE